MTAGGDGFLNFMGNEFGHPEWIDFPREGNYWSYHYARRQWSLADNKQLRYSELLRFFTDLIKNCSDCLSSLYARLIVHHRRDQVLCYERGNFYFFVNLNPEISFCDYGIQIPAGKYSLLLSTDSSDYGGYGRVPDDLSLNTIKCSDGINRLTPYLPSRTALVFKKE
jgi:1,4-alpha-glucan branching enzyme